MTLLEMYNEGNLDILNEVVEGDNFNVELLDINKFVKANNVQEITDPVFFIRDGVPSPNGLLSNEIFGITKDERSNIYGYIDLGGTFLSPLCYKTWKAVDSRIVSIVHETTRYIVNEAGELIKDEEKGSTGVDFLKKNFDKIKFSSTGSRIRDQRIEFLKKNQKTMFIDKFIVIPAYYRDANTANSAQGVGQINKYYSSLLISTRSIKETQDYGLSLSGSIKGRIQETLVNIYNCLCGLGDDKDGMGLRGKKGLVKNAVMSKTSDYGSRLVLSAPELKVETLDDMMVTIDYCALPLASAIANFEPFIIFNVKRFFEDNFKEGEAIECINKKGEIEYSYVKNPMVQFSDDVIMHEINNFIHGFSARLKPIEVKLENGDIVYPVFKSKSITADQMKNNDISGASPLANRRLTWCDVLYMAAIESCKDKHVMITRYPMDSYFNQFPNKINISTLRQTEKVLVNGNFYKFYPKIREEDIGKNTSNMFIDTCQIANLHLSSIGGDYDGDQVSVTGIYTVEANEEIDKKMKSLVLFVDLGGGSVKESTKEAVQAIYSLTKILESDKDKITDPVF